MMKVFIAIQVRLNKIYTGIPTLLLFITLIISGAFLLHLLIGFFINEETKAFLYGLKFFIFNIKNYPFIQEYFNLNPYVDSFAYYYQQEVLVNGKVMVETIRQVFTQDNGAELMAETFVKSFADKTNIYDPLSSLINLQSIYKPVPSFVITVVIPTLITTPILFFLFKKIGNESREQMDNPVFKSGVKKSDEKEYHKYLVKKLTEYEKSGKAGGLYSIPNKNDVKENEKADNDIEIKFMF